jgi:hypothetical protein
MHPGLHGKSLSLNGLRAAGAIRQGTSLKRSLKSKPRPCDRISEEGYRDGSGVFVTRTRRMVAMVNSQAWLLFEFHFGAPRLRHYLVEASGDADRAIRLNE